jgi:peptidoglycan/xylan/chitin deacetylase (PgdA/CDA1 family)
MITLMYHNLVARPEPDLPEVSYQVTVESFAWQVAKLAPRILDPTDLNGRFRGRHSSTHGVLLTFDDGAAGLMDGIEALRTHHARAVVFICPGQLECGLWYYRLAGLLATTRVTELRWRGTLWSLPRQRMSAHHGLLHELQRLSRPGRDEALSELSDLLPAPAESALPALRTANKGMLRAMAQSGCFLFANHTWSHPNLACLSPTEIAEEVDLAQHWLESSGLPTVPWLAFPHGGYNDRVVEIVKSRGLVPFGASARSTHSDVVPRVGIYRPDSRRWRFQAKLWLVRARIAESPGM